MNKKNIHIVIVENSQLISEGLISILSKDDSLGNLQVVESISEFQQINLRINANLVLINAALIQNQLKEFQLLKKEFEQTLWVGVVYSFYEQNLLSEFDEIITINEKSDKLLNKIENLLNTHQKENSQTQQESLSDREIDVLKLLVGGKANKEIADLLNISIHTVISHRKNISQKTGIKSVAGLTIYAVVNNIISI